MFKIATPVAAALLLAATSVDAKATGTVTFDQQFGTATSTDAIPVFLTFTLDAGSETLSTGPDSQITAGLSDQDLTDAGYDPAVYTDRLVNESAECSGSFFNGCGTSNSAYNFNFNFDPPAFVTPANFTLTGGQSYSFLFGTFTPNGVGAAPGTYQFFNASINFQLASADGSQSSLFTLASTCASGSDACAFTRVVSGGVAAVPEPAAWALMIGGFGLVGGAVRRRSRLALA